MSNMKKQLFILSACVIVLVCSSIAIVISTNHKASQAAATTTAVQQANKRTTDAQALLKAHDAVNNANIKAAGDRIIDLQNQKTTLCAQIKAAKLVQPLCQ